MASLLSDIYGALWTSIYNFERLLLHKPDTPAQRERILELRDSLYNPTKKPFDGLVTHQFWTDSDTGVVLHYLLTNPTELPPHGPRKTILYFHGFPDSPFSWNHVFSDPALRHHTQIALSLPSYGGSTPLSERYSPNTLYPLLVRFILHLKTTYPTQNITLVSHDWGGIIALALAHIVPPDLVSKIIASNCADGWGSKAFLTADLKSATKGLLKGHLPTFFKSWGRVIYQVLYKSHYIFCFKMSSRWLRLNGWGVKLVDYLGVAMGRIVVKDMGLSKQQAEEEVTLYRAALEGPLPEHVSVPGQVSEGIKYDSRVSTTGHTRFHEMLRFYREPLVSGRFKDSLLPHGVNIYTPDSESLTSPLAPNARGRFLTNPYRVPTTFMFSDKDHALNTTICTEGAKLMGARVVLLKGRGHWGIMGGGDEVVGEILRDD